MKTQAGSTTQTHPANIQLIHQKHAPGQFTSCYSNADSSLIVRGTINSVRYEVRLAVGYFDTCSTFLNDECGHDVTLTT